jgi:hypothetical protein
LVSEDLEPFLASILMRWMLFARFPPPKDLIPLFCNLFNAQELLPPWSSYSAGGWRKESRAGEEEGGGVGEHVGFLV